MSWKALTMSVLLPVAVMGCGAMDGGGAGAVPAAPSAAAGCKADAAQFVIGRSIDAALQEEARVRSGAETVRTLKPNQMVTMEFIATRLTINVDGEGKATSAHCG
ncbi:I78 family peptidase inhibitor [Variovorax terrae]|uniref:I78 family peptidase inhibitor n=1 Tax=Variovorax terrae TaxID=2923278 RepID=A0A9X2AMC6_9BURK|nr:I78 family peptidase inhibitor [Variovorax terrae]MCJ0763189.1 I78 family peptidase inhibitor [Variovorax terrae]